MTDQPVCPTCQGRGYNYFFEGDEDAPRRFGEEEVFARAGSQQCVDCGGSGKETNHET